MSSAYNLFARALRLGLSVSLWGPAVGLSSASATTQPAATSQPATGALFVASKAGAALNTDLLRGGGTDDTAILQSVLDRAAGGKPVHLIVDGPALVSGLDVYGNTAIEFSAGGGLYLKAGDRKSVV